MPDGLQQTTSESDVPTVPDANRVGEEPAVPRRSFLKFLMSFSIVSSIAMTITPIVGFLAPSKAANAGAGGKVLAGTLDTLPVGKGAVVAVGSKPAIVVNTAGCVRAFSAICTHLGCIVLWDETAGNIVCPCHDGRFNPATGAVMSGPPPAPLPPLTAVVEGNDIFIVTG